MKHQSDGATARSSFSVNRLVDLKFIPRSSWRLLTDVQSVRYEGRRLGSVQIFLTTGLCFVGQSLRGSNGPKLPHTEQMLAKISVFSVALCDFFFYPAEKRSRTNNARTWRT